MQLSTEKLTRIKKDWERIAGEKVEVELTNEYIYGFGSELATLRIFKKYRYCENFSQDYNKNINKFFVSLDISKYFISIENLDTELKDHTLHTLYEENKKDIQKENKKIVELAKKINKMRTGK